MQTKHIVFGGRGRGKMMAAEEWLESLPKEVREKVIVVKASDPVPGKDGVMGAITTVIEKDNLIMEELILKKERTSKTRPKGKGWEEVIMDDGRKAWVRLRKLTPREAGRLMGVSESNLNILLNSGISDSQLYKLFGNSIVVDCMVGIFRNAFTKEEVISNTLF